MLATTINCNCDSFGLRGVSLLKLFILYIVIINIHVFSYFGIVDVD